MNMTYVTRELPVHDFMQYMAYDVSKHCLSCIYN